jgi:phospholipid-transporting ATPase
MPLFWFGMLSAYSGTAMYDSILYQFYNLFFTSIPIIWFAVMDYEFSKEEFLKNHKYY